MSYEKHRPRDPHTDPMRSPSVLGQHPHLIRAHEDRTGDPSFMYETRDALGLYRPHPPNPVKSGPVGSAPSQNDSSFWLGLGLLGLAAVSAWALANSRRTNPTVHAPSPATVIVTPAAGAPQTATTEIIEASPAPPSAPEKKRRRVRSRRTTQARDARGHYLPAGTRSRATVEGKR